VPGEVDKVILLPRYTTLVGATDFITAPINVRPYATANISVWRGAMLGTTPTFSLVIQESPDLTEWSTLESYSTGAGSEDTKSVTFTMDWIRVKVTIGGAQPGVSCWAVGEFARREVARAAAQP
jgi:hypothetical protein